MNWDVGLSTVLAVVIFASAVLYRFSFLHQKKIWNLSIQQMIALVIIPGIIFPFIFAYLRSVESIPRNAYAFLPDALLINIILLSLIFAYGGTAIHAVTKMLSEYLKGEESELAQVNRFFHIQFSHILSYSAAMIAFMGLVLLEMNHVSTVSSGSMVWGSLKALGLGVAVVIGMKSYTRAVENNDKGRWNDLKIVFLVFWVGFIVFLLGFRQINPALTDYQLLLPALGVFAVMVFLSTVLVVRRVGHKWQVRIKRKELEKYIRG